MKMNKVQKSMLMLGLVMSVNAQAVEILIDDYSTAQGPLVDDTADNTAGSGVSGQVTGSGILGDYRDIYVQETEYPNSPFGGNGIEVEVASDRFNVDLGNLVAGYTIVTYDGDNVVGNDWEGNVNTAGLGGLDFSYVTDFFFDGVYNDAISPAFLSIWTDDLDDGTYVKHTLEFLTQGDSTQDDPFYDTYINASGFTDFANINWADVGALQMGFNLKNSLADSTISADLSLAEATAVPEPAALSILGASLMMLGLVGYRRKEQE